MSWKPIVPVLRNYRNDLLLWRYIARIPTGFESFVAENSALRSQKVSIIVAFEKPWVIELQLKQFIKNVRDFAPVVFDNSRSGNARTQIASICNALGVPCFALPSQRSRHANRSHGLAMTWIYRNFIDRLKPSHFCFIDHDLIPIEQFSFEDLPKDQAIYGKFNDGFANYWSLWAGYCFYKFTAIANKRLNFLYDFSRNLDTGGRNYDHLYRHLDATGLVFARHSLASLKIVNSEESWEMELIDGKWLHIGGVSYRDQSKRAALFCAMCTDMGSVTVSR